MNDNNQHPGQKNLAEFSDDAVRRFLLGDLRSEERPAFEERLLSDDRLEARVRLAEFDLADDYALARLSATDRAAFEQKFLLSADRKRKLNVSTALRDRFASAATVATTAQSGAKATISERLQRLTGFDRRAWRFVFGAVALFMLVAGAWLVLKESHIRRTIGPPIVRSSPSPGSKREAQHPPGPSLPPEHQTTPSPMPAHDQTTSSPTIASVELLPDASPDGNKLPSIDLPKGEHGIVRLQLALRANQTGIYRAELLAIDDQTIFSAQSLQATRADAGKVDFDIPAVLLKTGDYQVKLSRTDGGSKGSVASYYFRAQ